ncbi:hypothetical protein Vretimale_7217 [Volvox reticuliferus]|uniref:non-specific serine/threonine protein kinase n=2 Tax=Volvox reticuliferus TaxID=1737510 RepID=A0A8J4LL94_9CHLO|nr:hypothetical protein Vretimale_7217 [Volvox reticuliferus]
MLKDCTNNSKPPSLKTFQRRVKEQSALDRGTQAASDGPKPASVHTPQALLGACSTQNTDGMPPTRRKAAYRNVVAACCPGGLLKSLKDRRSSTSVIMPCATIMEAKGGRKKGGGSRTQCEQQLLAMKTTLNELVAYYDQVDEFELTVEEPGPSPQPENRRREGSTRRGESRRNNRVSIPTAGNMQQEKHSRMPILRAAAAASAVACVTATGMSLCEETGTAMAARAVATTATAARAGTQRAAVLAGAVELPADGLAAPRHRPHGPGCTHFSPDARPSLDLRASLNPHLRSSRDLDQIYVLEPDQAALEPLVPSVQHLGINEGGAADRRGVSYSPEPNSVPNSDSDGDRLAGRRQSGVSTLSGDGDGGRLAGHLQSEGTQQLQPVKSGCKEHSLCLSRPSSEMAGWEAEGDQRQEGAAAELTVQPSRRSSANSGSAVSGQRSAPSMPLPTAMQWAMTPCRYADMIDDVITALPQLLLPDGGATMVRGGRASHDAQSSLRASYGSHCVSMIKREPMLGDEDGDVNMDEFVAGPVTAESNEVVVEEEAEKEQSAQGQVGIILLEHDDGQNQAAKQTQQQLKAEVEGQSVQMERLQEHEDGDPEPGAMSRCIDDAEEVNQEAERIAIGDAHREAPAQAAEAVRAEQQQAEAGAVMQRVQEQRRRIIEIGDEMGIRERDREEEEEDRGKVEEEEEEERVHVAASSSLDLDQRRSKPSAISWTNDDGGVHKPGGGYEGEGCTSEAVLGRRTSATPLASPFPGAVPVAGNQGIPAGGAGDASAATMMVEEAMGVGLVPEPLDLPIAQVIPKPFEPLSKLSNSNINGGSSLAVEPVGHPYRHTDTAVAPGSLRRSSAVPSLTPLQHLLQVCGQQPLLELSELPTMDDIIDRLLAATAATGGGAKGRGRQAGATTAAPKRPAMVKVGEGSYGEAWRLGGNGGSNSRGGGVGGAAGGNGNSSSSSTNIVIKVVPIEGDMIFNNAPQKTAVDVMSEALANGTLSSLADGPVPGYERCTSVAAAVRNGSGEAGVGDEQLRANWTAGFVRTHAISVCRGPYSRDLVKAWERWDKQHDSENEPVSQLPPDQLYWIIAMDDSGTDLEKYVMESWDQLRSVLLQTAVSLAVAEAEVTFEHRDLHWGNVLVRRAEGRLDCGPDGWLGARLRGRNLRVATCGVASTIIDFTNSRLVTQDGLLLFFDLNQDPEVFEGPKGEVQFDTYRWMRSTVDDDWSSFCPATNCLWISYLAEVLCKRFGCGGSRAGCLRLSTVQKRQLREFRKRAVEYGSCGDLIWDELFKGLLQADG